MSCAFSLCVRDLTPRPDNSQTDFTRLNAQVRLLPVLPSPSPIALNHLNPTHANIRAKLDVDGETGNIIHIPTPNYNSALLMATTPRPHLLMTHSLMNDAPSFRDALALLRVWANQRGFAAASSGRKCIAGFDDRGYFWVALISLLLLGEEQVSGVIKPKKSSRKVVGKGLSSYQLFRAALDFLGTCCTCRMRVGD